MGIDNLRELPEISSMGVLIFDPIWREKEHIDRTAELIHVRKGSVDLAIGDNLCSAVAGDTLVVPSGAPHRDIFNLDSDFEVFLAHFTWSKEPEFWRIYDNHLSVTADPIEKSHIAAQVDLLREDLREKSPARRHVADSRCLTILLSLASLSESPSRKNVASSSDRRRTLMLKAKAYIDARYNEFIALGDIADALGVSPYHLSHVFSRECNFSLFSYLTDLRMKKAGELLKQGKLNVSEVAYAVAFDNSGYFSKVFKKYYGVSPSEYAGKP